jgi:hypothetical protein
LRLLEELLPQASRTLGNDHETTLGIRSGIANWIGEIGDHARAVELYEMVATDSARVLGPDDGLTIACRDHMAYEIGLGGDPDRAVTALSALLHDMEKQQQHPRDLWRTRYRVAYWMTEAGDHGDALSLWERLVADALAVFGRLHLWYLNARADHADCVGVAGDPVKAAQLLDEIMVDASQLEPHRARAYWRSPVAVPPGRVKQVTLQKPYDN